MESSQKEEIGVKCRRRRLQYYKTNRNTWRSFIRCVMSTEGTGLSRVSKLG